MAKKSRKLIANNKKARHDYFVEDSLEAGIVLTGTEIKSIRAGRCSIKESYVYIDKKGEMKICGMHISPFEQGNRFNVEPLRERKLLLHRREINKIAGKIKESGLTIIPLNVYLIGICRGKKLYDKRDSIAKKDADRKMDRAIKESRHR